MQDAKGVLQGCCRPWGATWGFYWGFIWFLLGYYIGVTGVSLGVLQGYITVVYQGQYSCVREMVNDTRVF